MTPRRALRSGALCTLLWSTASASPGLAQTKPDAPDAKEATRADSVFEAWSADYLEFDPAIARRSWASVIADSKYRRADRNFAFSRLVHLSRLSGDFDQLAKVSNELKVDPSIDANSRNALYKYLDLLTTRQPAVFRDVQSLVEGYRATKRAIQRRAAPAASQAKARAKARADLFRTLQAQVKRAPAPISALMPDLTRYPARTILGAGPVRQNDLAARIDELARLTDEIRRRQRSGRDLGRLVRQREKLQANVKRIASRRLSDRRAEISAYEQVGNHKAVEAIVELCLPLERLWPHRAKSYSLVEALEDPIYRRDALRRIRAKIRARMKHIADQQPERAREMQRWLVSVRESVLRGSFHEAARATLDIIAADPDFLPKDAQNR